MYELAQNAKRLGCGMLLAVLLLALSTPGASAAGTGEPRCLTPVGHTVGIKLFSKGVLVVRLPEGDTPAKECGLRQGDVIVSCGGTPVLSTEQFQALLQQTGEDPTDLRVDRAGRQMTLSVAPEQNARGDYSIGAWIRDSMAGIGTVTYYDPATGTFGALGHGVTDADTAMLMPFSAGSVLPSTVKAVKKGQVGSAGELRGDFDLSRDLGSLRSNTAAGVFGHMEPGSAPWLTGTPLPVARPEEVETGEAVILCNVRGDAVEEFKIKIERVLKNAPDGRDLVLSVTDPALLAATGGIVQGMSGSPIIHNGKFVGAVTHVLLNDPTRGYGIFIENMLESA